VRHDRMFVPLATHRRSVIHGLCHRCCLESQRLPLLGLATSSTRARNDQCREPAPTPAR
jgi:hypothetical protein